MPKFVVKQSSDINQNEISTISNNQVGNINDISSIHPRPQSTNKESNEITYSDGTFKILSEMKSDEFNDDIGPDEHKAMNKKIKKTIKSEIKQKFMTKNVKVKK